MLLTANRRALASYFATLDPTSLVQGREDLSLQLARLERNEVLLEFRGAFVAQGAIPSRIVIHEDDVDDFFAWASTYIEVLSPLTGFVDVWSREEALDERLPMPLTQRHINALIGATLMDGLLQSKSRMKVPDSILPATLRTLSAVFFQAAIVGSTQRELSDASRMWTTIRGDLQSAEMPFDIRSVISFWGSVMPSFSRRGALPQGPLSAVIDRFLNDTTRGDNPWKGTQYSKELLLDIDEMLEMPREERIRLADTRLSGLASSNLPQDVKDALGGYLLAVVGDGDFALWPTAIDAGPLLSMPLWFGFFSGGWKSSNVLGFNQAIGRHLPTLLEYRSNDIDIDAREFLISRRLKTRSATSVDFPLSTFNVLKARLAPSVCGWFSVREPQAAQSQRDKQEDARTTAATSNSISSQQFQLLRNDADKFYLVLTNMNLVLPPPPS